MKKKMILGSMIMLMAVLGSACRGEKIASEEIEMQQFYDEEQETAETEGAGTLQETEAVTEKGGEQDGEEAEAEVQESTQEVIEYQIEGEAQTENLTRVSGSAGYTIPYDAEKFSFETTEGIDSIVSDSTAEDGSYMASLTIFENTGVTAEAFVEGLLHQAPDDAKTEEAAVGKSGTKATHIFYEKGNKYADMYVIDRGENCLMLEMWVEKEAYEGLGASLHKYIDEIEFDQ